MIPLDSQRRYFAEELEAVANLRTPGLVDAFAAVPRERFLAEGPWTLKSDADFGGPGRLSADADPRRLYHNVAVAIDVDRLLYNGMPGFVALCIDALALEARSGSHVVRAVAELDPSHVDRASSKYCLLR